MDNINTGRKGLMKDLSPIDHNEQTLSFALNALYSNIDGRAATVQTESGNSVCYSLPQGFNICGHVNIGRDEVLIISKSDEKVQFGISSNDCNYRPLLTSSCLQASFCNYTKGLFRIIKGCERIVYLYNGIDYDLSINLDNLEQYTQTYEDTLLSGKTVLKNYTVLEANENDLWDCNQMRLEPEYLIPCVSDLKVINGGGSLELGKWRFAIELLDEDLNRIGFSQISQPIDIWDESITDEWDNIDGGYNLSEQFSSDIGGVIITNKSVEISLSNMDTRFPYARIHAIVKRTGNGLVLEAFAKGDVISINEDTITYNFTGIDTNNGDTISAVSDIITPRERYKSSGSMEFIDKRLVRANLKKESRDWAPLQRAASAIGTQYIVKEFDIKSKDKGDNKNPETSFDTMSLMGDEIEPHAIVWVMEDGTLSPPFHIPGRAINTGVNGNTLLFDDNFIIDTWTENIKPFFDNENEYNALPINEKLRLWQIRNTAQSYADGTGELAYHQCDTACYPDIRDCSGESIWGTDIHGNELVNTPIRHIKMPDRVVERLRAGDKLRSLGLRFSNVIYPQGVVGHYFVKPKRNETNKTVLSSGYIFNACEPDNEDYVGFSYLRNPDSQHKDYLSAETLVEGKSINATYLKNQARCNVIQDAIVIPDDNNIDGAGVPFGGDDLQLGTRSLSVGQHITTSVQNRVLETNRIISALSKIPGATHFVNLLWDNKVNHLELTDFEEQEFDEANYVYLKNTKDVFCNLDSIQYYHTNSCMFTSESNDVFTGDVYISEVTQWRQLLSDIKEESGGLIFDLLSFGLIGLVYTAITGSNLAFDIIRSALTFSGILGNNITSIINDTKDSRYEDCVKDDDMPGVDGSGTFGSSDGFVVFNSERVHGLWVESSINFNMVHYGTSEYSTGFKSFVNSTYEEQLKDYATFKSVTINDDDEVQVRSIILPETYFYNKDYSSDREGNIFIPLSLTYDYCSECEEDNPNTVIWSERSFEREISDANRIFLPLNTTQVGSHAGDITNIKYDRNRMFIITENSAFALAPNPRILQTDAEQVFTGVGDFLSIPEQEFVKTSYGYGGCQTRYGTINTPFGYIYPDAKSGEIFLYGSSLERLSDKGMRNWFKENLPLQLVNFLEDRRIIDFDCIDTINNIGVGFGAVYDPRYSRYILHKRDFLPINFKGTEEGFGLGTYRLDGEWKFFNGNQYVTINIGDPAYFEDYSWTISYSFIDQSWASFHSYQPNYMYNDHDTFYTFNFNGNTSWKHGDYNYTNYYNTKYNFIIEYILNDYRTNDLHAIHWYSQSKLWDIQNKQWVDRDDITFDKMIIYNSCQNTGEQELTYLNKQVNPYGNRIGWSNTTKDVIRIEKDYKVSGIRDLSIEQPTMSEDWIYKVQEFSNGGYIDKNVLPDNIDYNRNQHQLPDMKDKYHVVRLFAKPDEDAAIELNLANSVTFASIH